MFKSIRFWFFFIILFVACFFGIFVLMAREASANPSHWNAPCPDGNGTCLWYPCRDSNGVGECTDAQAIVSAPAIRQPVATTPAPSTVMPAPAPEAPTSIPWGWIIAGLIAVGVVLYMRRCSQIRRREVRVGLEDSLVAAQIAYTRDRSNVNADRVTWAKAALHRHDHPNQPLVNEVRANVTVDPSNGHVPGEPFMNNPPAPAP